MPGQFAKLPRHFYPVPSPLRQTIGKPSIHSSDFVMGYPARRAGDTRVACTGRSHANPPVKIGGFWQLIILIWQYECNKMWLLCRVHCLKEKMMENPTDAPSALPNPRKPGKMLWLLIPAAFLCICACVAVPVVAVIDDPTLLNVFKTGAPKTKIEAGTYEGAIYTAPDGNFSCDFGLIMIQGMNPILRAYQDKEAGTGTAFVIDDTGKQYGVDYFRTKVFREQYVAPLANPDTRREALQVFLDDILLPVYANATISHQEFLPGDILYAILYQLEGSPIISVSALDGTETQLDYQQGYYIFATEEWVYFVYSFVVPDTIFPPLSPPDMQSRLDEFYRGCQFQP